MAKAKKTRTSKPAMRPPSSWFGGKALHAGRIMPLMPTGEDIYVEVFGGMAALLFARQPASVEVYNDLDSGLYNFFRVLSEPKLFGPFKRRVQAMPYSREFYNHCRNTWESEKARSARAAKWFCVARQSFAGHFAHSWAVGRKSSSGGMAARASIWINTIDRLEDVLARVQRCQIENQDWRDCLAKYDTPETLFYIDPPYVPETRRSGTYAHELTAEDHAELIDRILQLRGRVVLSGYDSAIYKPLKRAGFKMHSFDTICMAAGTRRNRPKQKRTECVWVSPEKTRKKPHSGKFATPRPRKAKAIKKPPTTRTRPKRGKKINNA